jgi:CRISPR/Cas system CMR-associated protein Cmr5 small subunit
VVNLYYVYAISTTLAYFIGRFYKIDDVNNYSIAPKKTNNNILIRISALELIIEDLESKNENLEMKVIAFKKLMPLNPGL